MSVDVKNMLNERQKQVPMTLHRDIVYGRLKYKRFNNYEVYIRKELIEHKDLTVVALG